MPRSLQTQGVRSLGRLAFADNQQRLLARLKREVEEATTPDNVFQSVTQTGLALRDSKPRIYVIAAAGGGASGMLARPRLCSPPAARSDAASRLQSQSLAFLRHPQDPASPKTELANIYATLTELNHFSDPSIAFAAQYGVDGQRLVDERAPYQSVYLLPLAHRTPEALEQTVSHLGNYLFHELTTPLGPRLDHLPGIQISTVAGPPVRCLVPCGVSAPIPSGSRVACCCVWPHVSPAAGSSRVEDSGADQVAEEVQGEIAKFLEQSAGRCESAISEADQSLESLAQAGSVRTREARPVKCWRGCWPNWKNSRHNTSPRTTRPTGQNKR